MPRSNSILLFGEGKTEAVFLSHLRDLYRVTGTVIKVEHGRGGSVRTVVQSAIKIASLADYSGILILLDSDRDDEPIPPGWVSEHRLSIKQSTPCLEALLLEILGDSSLARLRHGASASDRCKSHFYGSYLGTDRSGQVVGRMKNVLRTRVPKELLDDARTRIPVLDEIIHAIRGGIRKKGRSPMPDPAAERAFQDEIIAHLTARGWLLGVTADSGRLTGNATTSGGASGFTGTLRDASGRLIGTSMASGKCKGTALVPVPPPKVKKQVAERLPLHAPTN